MLRLPIMLEIVLMLIAALNYAGIMCACLPVTKLYPACFSSLFSSPLVFAKKPSACNQVCQGALGHTGQMQFLFTRQTFFLLAVFTFTFCVSFPRSPTAPGKSLSLSSEATKHRRTLGYGWIATGAFVC